MHLDDPLASSQAMRRSRLLRGKPAIFLGVVVVALIIIFSLPASSGSALVADGISSIHSQIDKYIPTGGPGHQVTLPFQRNIHAHNYALSSAQCDAYFPGLYEDIDRSVERRKDKPIQKFELDDQGDDKSNTRVMVYDGDASLLHAPFSTNIPLIGHQLYIISDGDVPPDERTISVLHDLHRALITDPERHKIPNVEFIVGREDWVKGDQVIFGFTKKATDNEAWMLPDFGFWTWATPSVGSYQAVRRKMEEVEESYPAFDTKIDKLVWRGSVDVGDGVRQSLMRESRDKPWADVEELDWRSGHLPYNLLYIEDHCKYRFIAQTEGNSYSGRQKYIHNCNSVVVSHELEWLQPWHKFMIASGPDQNYIHVHRNFSDLDEKMTYYSQHPEIAAKIAKNNVRTFRDRYVTPAAQACYWRKLIRGYGSVSFEPELYEEPNAPLPDGYREDTAMMHRSGRRWRGTPFENYVVNGQLDTKVSRTWGYGCRNEEQEKKDEEERLRLQDEEGEAPRKDDKPAEEDQTAP